MERLGEIGKVLSGLCDAVKSMKSIRQNSAELLKVTEEAKKHAEELEDFYLPAELQELKPKLQELKKLLKKVPNSASKLEVWLKVFGDEVADFEKFLRNNIKGSTIPQEVLMELCEKLKKMYGMASDFSESFQLFVNNLSEAQPVATELGDQLRKKAEAKNKEASSKRNWGIAKTLGVAAGGAAIAALGFFTGGVGWAVAGAVAGTAAAGAVGGKTVVDVKKMRDLASGILSDAKELGALATKLKSESDRAGMIKLDKEALEALKTALEFYKKDLDKDERIVQQQTDLEEKDRRIAELEAQLQGLKN